MKNFFKRIFSEKKKPFVFTTRNLALNTMNGERIADSSNSFFTVNDAVYGSSLAQSNGVLSYTTLDNPKETKKEDPRKVVEPKAVFEEIKKEGPELSFDNLDEKIKTVTERIDILKEHLDESHLGDEHKTLFYLKNRKTYLKTMKKNPIDWAVTTREAVDDLCKIYKLRVVPLKQYYTLVPKEGISEMARYTRAYKAVTKDNPIFELIIKEAEVKSEEEKQQKKKDRDPILLANSPLSNAMFVLGAWDDEVEIVDEIIYQGK